MSYQNPAALTLAVFGCLLLVAGCKSTSLRSTEAVYTRNYDITYAMLEDCEELHNEESSEFWNCSRLAYTEGVCSEEGSQAAISLGVSTVSCAEIKAGIELLKSVWLSHEAGEMSYEAAKLKDSEIQFRLHRRN